MFGVWPITTPPGVSASRIDRSTRSAFGKCSITWNRWTTPMLPAGTCRPSVASSHWYASIPRRRNSSSGPATMSVPIMLYVQPMSRSIASHVPLPQP